MKKILIIIFLLSFLFGCCDSYPQRFASGRYYVNWCKSSYCVEKDTGIDCYDKKDNIVITLERKKNYENIYPLLNSY